MPKSAALPTKNWGKRFFRKNIFHPNDAATLARAPKEVAFLWRILRLARGRRLLDLCCGAGRHSILFAQRGAAVVGLDATAEYLREARRRARGNPRARFIQGDMRDIPFDGEFDAAVNLWTSFGYFLRPADDLKTLRGAARALKPGGRFLIDIINADFLRAHGQGRRWDRLPGGGVRLEDFKMREGRDPAHINTWTLLRRGRRPVSASLFVRAYDRPRLTALLRRAGLVPIRCWGSLEGGRFKGPESSRLVILARKPGRQARRRQKKTSPAQTGDV